MKIVKKDFFSKNKSLINKSILYLFFNVFNGAIPFLLLPILTTYLPPSDYGSVALFQTTLLFIVPLVGLSMGFNIDRLFFKINREDLSIVMGNMIAILIAMVLLFIGLIFITSFFSELSFIGLPIKWVLFIPIVAGFASLNSFNLIILRNKDSVKHFGLWQVGLTGMNLGLSLLFVVALAYGWEGRTMGISIATCLFGVGSLFNIYKMGYLKLSFDTKQIKEILNFCIPLLLQGLGAFVIFQSNRYFINDMIGKSSVGIYSVAYAFASIMLIFQDAIVKTINPWFYKNLNSIDENLKTKVVKMNLFMFLLFFLFSIVLFFVSKLLVLFMLDEKYQNAINFVFLLTLGLAFNGMYKICAVYFIHLSKTKLLSKITGITALFSLPLTYFLILNYGLHGAVLSFCISLFLQFILTLIFSNIIYPLPYKKFILFYSNKIKQ